MAVLLPVARQQYLDANGDPISGGSVAFCVPNTSGNQFGAIWADEAATIPLQNPCPLDSAGIAFSGGSQVSVWGTGKYEKFVRNADGSLVYSALLDTAASISGGTIEGNVQINGALVVSGSISTSNTITGGQINGNNANISGGITTGSIATTNLTASNATINSGLTVHGSETIDGNLNVAGGAGVGGTLTSGALNTGNISANNITANTLNGSVVPQIRAGTGTSNAGGLLSISFSPPFNGTPIVVATLSGKIWYITLSVESPSAGGASIWAIETNTQGIGVSVGISWIAVGP